MKLVKMSLAAALLVSGAYALDNVKVNGSAKLIYQTVDTDNAGTSLFSRSGNTTGGSQTTNSPTLGTASTMGGAQVLLGASADLVENISAGAEVQVFSTLGLENNLVDTVMATGNGQDQWNMSQLWMAASYGKTTVKVGRMELDTPLAFTEKWNVAKNTFEAAVVINSDLPDTTLVGAYVGKDNGNMNSPLRTALTGSGTIGQGSTAYMGALSNGAVANNTFNSFYGGAYAAGIVNTSIENVTAQGWYYNVDDIATAIWLQADAKNVADLVDIGVQYGSMDPSANLSATASDLDAWAVKISGTVSDINIFVAYSDVDNNTVNSGLLMANTATQDKTKLYTGTSSVYMDGGVVGSADTQTWKVGASTNVAGYSLAASYANADNGGNGTAANAWDVDCLDLSVGTKVGAIDLKLIYNSFDADTTKTVAGLTSAYVVGEDFQAIRIVAGVKF
jgi:hypothetical protein